MKDALMELSTYDPNNLLDSLIFRLNLKNDAALSRTLEVAPPVLSKIRHRRLPIGATMLIRMHEVSDVSIKDLRNLTTDAALEANIKAAAQAQFKLQEEKNRLEVARVEAERKRAEAQGDADAIRIKAEAVAKQGGAEYVQLQAIAKWDGKLPVTQAGGAVPFLNVK